LILSNKSYSRDHLTLTLQRISSLVHQLSTHLIKPVFATFYAPKHLLISHSHDTQHSGTHPDPLLSLLPSTTTQPHRRPSRYMKMKQINYYHTKARLAAPGFFLRALEPLSTLLSPSNCFLSTVFILSFFLFLSSSSLFGQPRIPSSARCDFISGRNRHTAFDTVQQRMQLGGEMVCLPSEAFSYYFLFFHARRELFLFFVSPVASASFPIAFNSTYHYQTIL
jgi:hypothetical protein